MSDWDQTKLQQLIDDRVEESLLLDYKAAAALDKTDAKKAEITKDVSALANSAGGILIYGISEVGDKEKSHLPEKIDPVLRSAISKEWLEQVISGIRPRIDNLVIHPIPVNDNTDQVVYIVEVPQSATAHQSKDCRYYRRYNFESVPMADHEIRDVMGRRQQPRIEISLKFVHGKQEGMPFVDAFRGQSRPKIIDLIVSAQNTGKVLASYVNCYVSLPERFCTTDPHKILFAKPCLSEPYEEIRATNTTRDVVGHSAGFPQHGPARHDPILPGMNIQILKYRIKAELLKLDLMKEPGKIAWKVYADNAPSLTGEIAIAEIPVANRPLEDT